MTPHGTPTQRNISSPLQKPRLHSRHRRKPGPDKFSAVLGKKGAAFDEAGCNGSVLD
ncbi:predicted protein [Plenodomus lingam JN3]|uniref:Predicted protein n=1 Tax=Leptosphaeria maculans (strain JN3 / isolate v23.1.3 / race Av1-4-5-6-7-8) TaxID=985895 RepID=E5AEY3_LEPMJ|nr:predicted protein [Plenodomus lingam JN3]CBY01772.1 predicted protein [Plenodomus lingam JN3]